MNRFIYLLILIISCGLSAIGQSKSDALKPTWIKRLPQTMNYSYDIKRVNAYGGDLKTARDNCLSTIISNTGLECGITIVSNNKTSDDLSQVYNNGKLTEQIKYNSKTVTESRSKEISLQVLVIDEYWEYTSNGYNLTVCTLCLI